MKRLLLTSSLAVLLLSSAAAVAGPDKDHDKHDRDRHDQHDDRDRHDDRRDDDRRYDDRRHDNGRHLGEQKHAWKRGGYAPREYLGDRYYVRDYRSHRLSAPPRGYRWVRPEPQSDRYLLIQATTGLISQVFGY